MCPTIWPKNGKSGSRATFFAKVESAVCPIEAKNWRNKWLKKSIWFAARPKKVVKVAQTILLGPQVLHLGPMVFHLGLQVKKLQVKTRA